MSAPAKKRTRHPTYMGEVATTHPMNTSTLRSPWPRGSDAVFMGTSEGQLSRWLCALWNTFNRRYFQGGLQTIPRLTFDCGLPIRTLGTCVLDAHGLLTIYINGLLLSGTHPVVDCRAPIE